MKYAQERSTLTRTILIWALLAVLPACGGGGSDPAGPNPPQPPADFVYNAPPTMADMWDIADARAIGMSASHLEQMMNSIRNGDFPIIDSVAIAHRGKLVLHETVRTGLNEFDDSVGNIDPDVHALFSASKSIASIGIGIAIDQGIIESTAVPYLGLFPYADYDNWDDRKADITLHDVLSMRLGLEWNEWDPPYNDPENQMFRFYDSETDFSKSLLDLPMAADPGAEFAYNTVATVSLGQAIENTAPLTLIDFGSTFLFGPLGISKVEVMRTPTGLPDLGRGLFLTTRDLLKFGQLYLDGGRWAGQQIVSETWISRSTTSYTDITWAEPETMDWQIDGYGYQWWVGHFDFEGRQLDTFAGWGAGEQWLMVVPELQLVVAIHAHAWQLRPEDTNQVFTLIKRFILPSVDGQANN